MVKPTKNAIAYVIYNDDRSKFLVVQRPGDDKDLPNAWGLPAGSLEEGESFEDAVLRSGREKLGVKLSVGELVGEGEIERDTYVLYMKEYEATIAQGEPKAPQGVEGVTQYQQWRWGTADDVVEAAQKGSLCSRLYLSSIGRAWQR